MKIFLTALFLLTLLTVVALPSHAEDSTSSPTRKNVVKQKVDTKRELVAQLIDTRREKVATRTAALKLKLDGFRDRRKASASARINDNLARVNQNRTGQMLQHLSRLYNILSKLEIRVNAVTDKDTSSAKAAIASAKVAIDTATASANLQLEKDYTLTITSESKVKEDATAERQLLHSDLKNLHDLVVAARQAVAYAISQTAQLGGIKNGQ